MGPDFNDNGRIDAYDVGTLETFDVDSSSPDSSSPDSSNSNYTDDSGCYNGCMGCVGSIGITAAIIGFGGGMLLFLFFGVFACTAMI